MKRKAQKEVKKVLKKTNKSILICSILFLILGFAIGFTIITLITKNDTFELIGDKTITLNVNDEYVEQGVKVISFNKDLKDKISIESNVNTSIEGEYTIVYTIKDSFKYKNIKRVRYVRVVMGSDNNE